MFNSMSRIFAAFGRRMRNDHMGAYAATCAYFLMISIIPLLMVLLAIVNALHGDESMLATGVASFVPEGLRDYLMAILREISVRSFFYVPISLLILLWSASKAFHAITNGLNVISRVEETRGWFFLRFRSMVYVVIFMLCAVLSLVLAVFGQQLGEALVRTIPFLRNTLGFVYNFRSIFSYIALFFVFLFIYKFLPNCRYTLRSQIPGALIVSTVWMFFSYIMTVYYRHNANFTNIYGNLTGIILAMIWLYFCCYFLLFGAELNRSIYEDPDGNIIVSAVDAFRDESARRRLRIQDELDEHSLWKSIGEGDSWSAQPVDIYIPWADETEPEVRTPAPRGQMFDDAVRELAGRKNREKEAT